MLTRVELTDQEIAIIESALCAYLNEAEDLLVNQKVFMSDGSKRPLGTLEAQILSQRKELVYRLLTKFENL